MLLNMLCLPLPGRDGLAEKCCLPHQAASEVGDFAFLNRLLIEGGGWCCLIYFM